MTFRTQFLVGLFGGACCLALAWAVLGVHQVVLRLPTDSGVAAKLAGTLAFVGLFALVLTLFRWLGRVLFVKTGALQQGYLGDVMRDIPFWQWMFHIDKVGKDRDA